MKSSCVTVVVLVCLFCFSFVSGFHEERYWLVRPVDTHLWCNNNWSDLKPWGLEKMLNCINWRLFFVSNVQVSCHCGGSLAQCWTLTAQKNVQEAATTFRAASASSVGKLWYVCGSSSPLIFSAAVLVLSVTFTHSLEISWAVEMKTFVPAWVSEPVFHCRDSINKVGLFIVREPYLCCFGTLGSLNLIQSNPQIVGYLSVSTGREDPGWLSVVPHLFHL